MKVRLKDNGPSDMLRSECVFECSQDSSILYLVSPSQYLGMSLSAFCWFMKATEICSVALKYAVRFQCTRPCIADVVAKGQPVVHHLPSSLIRSLQHMRITMRRSCSSDWHQNFLIRASIAPRQCKATIYIVDLPRQRETGQQEDSDTVTVGY